MKVRLSRRADAEIDGIEIYTVEHFGVAQWLAYSAKLEQGFETIRRFPGIGISRPPLPSGHRAFRIDQHWACYQILPEEIVVTAVVTNLDDFSNPRGKS